MACKHWNDDWVARLYGELDPGEERALEADRVEVVRYEQVTRESRATVTAAGSPPPATRIQRV
mgnify:CR=1 FL=1